MAFTRSSLIRFTYQLFFLAVVIWINLSCQGGPPNIVVKIFGSPVNFTCPGDTTKNYTFTFFHKKGNNKKTEVNTVGNDRIKQDKSTLIILRVTTADGGDYYCEVRNQAGGVVFGNRKIAMLFLKNAPNFDFTMSPKAASIPVDEGDKFTFTCEYAKSGEILKWWKLGAIKGSKLNTEIPREKITALSDSSKSKEQYVIKAVTLADSATYRCEVMEGGKPKFTTAHVLQVRKNEKPTFPFVHDIYYVKQLDENYEIDFDLKGSPFPNLTCSREGKEIISCSGKKIKKDNGLLGNPCKRDDFEISDIAALIITKVYYSVHNGKYNCVATNIVGSANVTFTVNVTVWPTISIKNSAIFYQEINKEGTVTCAIKEANPRPVIKWYSQTLLKLNDNPKNDSWSPSNLKQRFNALAGGKFESILIVPADVTKWSFYLCNASNSAGFHTRVYKFLRFDKGEDPVVVTPSEPQVVNEGETFIAKCRVTDSITGDIVFFNANSGKEIRNDTKKIKLTLEIGKRFRNLTMTITNLTVNDSGTYRCTERKMTNQKAIVDLKVKALRRTTIFWLRNKTIVASDTVSVTLLCNVSGNPFPDVTWYQDGERLKKNNLIENNLINCDTREKGYYHYKDAPHRLVICKPSRTYTGDYTCFGKNLLGNDSANAYLDVLSYPDITNSGFQKLEKREGDRIEITCTAVGNPAPFVHWIKNGETPATNESIGASTLVIERFDESSIGNYSCSAKNRLKVRNELLLQLEMLLPENTQSETQSGGMATGTIIGIVIAVIVFVVLFAVLCILWQRSQQRKLLFYKHQYFLKTGDYSVDPSRTLNEQSLNLPYDSDWEFPFEKLVIGDVLGAGAFGEVFKAEALSILTLNPRDKSGAANKRRSKLRRSIRASMRKKKTTGPETGNATVAVKTVKATATESEIRDLASELKLMIHLGQHKNIVNLLGACTTGRRLYVILEFCPHGNLLSFLRGKRDLYDNTWVKEVFDPEKEFTLVDLVGAAFQVAKGMEFLASRKLIHRDLAARNILVGDEYVMKISDFGLARDIYKDDIYVKTSSGLLPVKWMAIESLFDRVYTHQSDVWAFGVLLWEMMTLGGTPYPGLPAEQLLDYLHNGKRMQQPSKCPLEVYTIMRDCWQEDPEQRPTFSNLGEHLGRMLERHLAKENPYLQLEATPEEIEAAKEKDALLQQKSDYYLQPLLLSNKQHGYDANAPLPTTPPDVSTPTNEIEPKSNAESNGEPSKTRAAGSYERLREDNKDTVGHAHPVSVSPSNESGIELDDMNDKNMSKGANEAAQPVETVV